MTKTLQHSTEIESELLVVLKNQEIRLKQLEENGQKHLFKRLTETASAGALFLGLVLTFASLYDAFITKPEAGRIARLSEFNKAVNAAAKLRADLVQIQFQSPSPQLLLAMQGAATPQILNNISTARAMIRDLDINDVEIPQLIVLISEAFTAGDLESAKAFVARAVSKTNATPYLRSEAKRFEGKYYFIVGQSAQGRKSFDEAVNVLGDAPAAAAARAYVLSDLVTSEYALRICEAVADDIRRLSEALKAPGMDSQRRMQLTETVKSQFLDNRGQNCPSLSGLDSLLEDK